VIAQKVAIGSSGGYEQTLSLGDARASEWLTPCEFLRRVRDDVRLQIREAGKCCAASANFMLQ